MGPTALSQALIWRPRRDAKLPEFERRPLFSRGPTFGLACSCAFTSYLRSRLIWPRVLLWIGTGVLAGPEDGEIRFDFDLRTPLRTGPGQTARSRPIKNRFLFFAFLLYKDSERRLRTEQCPPKNVCHKFPTNGRPMPWRIRGEDCYP